VIDAITALGVSARREFYAGGDKLKSLEETGEFSV